MIQADVEVAPLLVLSELLLRLLTPSRARADPARHLGLFQQLQLAQLGLLVGVAFEKEERDVVQQLLDRFFPGIYCIPIELPG